MIEHMNAEGNLYGTTYFLRGALSGIRNLVSESLCQNAVENADLGEFGMFDIGLADDDFAFVCYSPKYNLSRPSNLRSRRAFSVWRAGNDYFLIDAPQYLDALLPLLQQESVSRVELSFAAQQRNWANQWRRHKRIVRCELCEKDYPIENCADVVFEAGDNAMYARFECPQCRVPQIDEVPGR